MPLVTANKIFSHIRGFNYQPSYGSTGFELWHRFDAAVIDLELGRGKKYFPAMNTIRLWLSWDAFLRKPIEFAKNFDIALGLAAKHGLKVMPVLFNRWHDQELDYGGIYIDHFLPGACLIQKPDLFDAYIEQIVGPHANDDRIFSWDLCNEPFLYTKGRAILPDHPNVEPAELAWLTGIHDLLRKQQVKAPITIGTHQATDLNVVDHLCDIISIHPYWWSPDHKYIQGPSWGEVLDRSVAVANKNNKPLIISECCWGSENDPHRVEIIRLSLTEFRKREIPFLAYLLHHSLIADAHRAEFGPVGKPGNLSFIEADGSLRPGHEIWNEFAVPF